MFSRQARSTRPDSALSSEGLSLAQAMMGTTSRVLCGNATGHEIVERYCHALTQASAHLPLVWAWFGDASSRQIHPQVAAGRSVAWARGLRINRNLLTERGPAFRALDGHATQPFEVSPLSLWAPWREAARTEGIRSVLCAPLQRGMGLAEGGVVVLYADAPDYFEGLTGFFESLAQMFGSILQQSAVREGLARAATTDALTGVGNRLRFEQLCDGLPPCPSQRLPMAVLIADLDRFKTVNDTYGHAAGDTVLRGTARELAAAVRHSDTVLRLGGEEFVVALPQVTAAQAAEVAEDMRRRLEACLHPIEGHPGLRVTGSFGVAQLEPGETLRDALRRADGALYAAKHGGRNRVCIAAQRAHREAVHATPNEEAVLR